MPSKNLDNSPPSISLFYNEKWSNTVWEDMVLYSPISRHINRWILKLIHLMPEKPKTIVEVGCGNGKLLTYLHKKLNMVTYSGSDISEVGIQQCKEKFPSGDFLHQDLTKVENPFHKIFDLCICSEVIEHLEDDQAAFESFSLMGRYVILTVPAGPLDEMSKGMGHYRHYSGEELEKKLHNVGFEIVYRKEWGAPFAYPLYSSLRNKMGMSYVTGHYKWHKKILTHFLYSIFHLNDFFNFGNQLFILARNTKFASHS
ncbi:MAG: class I SAM-dependent methyltransferase [Proteobacteria bacterium]|nr:class I SAM-dependent methyltransferase [Pseudomonadota bacterium]